MPVAGKSAPIIGLTEPTGAVQGSQTIVNNGESVPVKTGEFFTKSLGEAAKIFLDRKAGAASYDEIFDALKRGGYKMRGAGSDEYKRLRLNLLKSTSFTFIPEDNFGLASMFPRKRKTRKPKPKKLRKPKIAGPGKSPPAAEGENPKRGRPKKVEPITEVPNAGP